jgi:hypothetical protein
MLLFYDVCCPDIGSLVLTSVALCVVLSLEVDVFIHQCESDW